MSVPAHRPPPPSGPTTPARTLSDHLRAWPDEALAHLLHHRPDLASPAPHDSAQLASRASARASVLRALDELTVLELAVLDASVVLGHATRDELLAVVAADPEVAGHALDHLLALALVWPSTSGLRTLGGVADALRGVTSRGVSGLRPVVPHALSSAEAAARVDRLSAPARALLTHVADQGGEATTGRARTPHSPEEATSPVEEVLAHGLLVPTQNQTYHLPGQVGLALRGGTTTSAPVDDVPPLATTERDPALVDRVAAGAAFECVRRTELLLDHWGTHPPTVLRSGGLGVRDLKAVTTELHVDAHQAGLLLEVAVAAGLLAEGFDTDGVAAWLPTHAFDTWAALGPAERWATLAKAWWHTMRLPGLAGTKDATGRTRNALAPDSSSALAPEAREMALRELVDLPRGSALAAGTGVPSLVARLRWLRPRRPSSRDEMVAWALDEAAALGLTGMGAAAAWAAPFVAGDVAAAAEAVAPAMPAPVDHLLVQADLTAVAPGPLTPELARAVHLLADVESRGGATVHRFTPTSLRRALDAGWSGAEIHDFLARTSRTPVPQPLTYLVDDVVRTFGTFRVGHAESFLRADDEQALTELLLHPGAASLELRRLAPTVLVSALPVDLLLPRLRELGQAPVVEAADGTVHVARPDLQRARTPRTPSPTATARARETAQVARVVAAVRAGDRAAAAAGERPTSATTPLTALALLRDAIDQEATVLIGYVDNHGTSTDRIVDPLRLEGGQLLAYDHRSEDERTFSVHRITKVGQAAD
ncbi:helicase-associated domain-containing protein [Nocardioides sp. Y6]|uniref:Helicase-associated domain-containing protein n=1 Tax=Nocardioides malaquae TaxID=2773426 RepID=A0ABR9RTS0_9ACTN|nr:helicase C-terminal domain-containing protein [Nocardioides malaquae]MBE7324998.1 helicase-associated domain-containing protein [Nocardioides malaquae]